MKEIKVGILPLENIEDIRFTLNSLIFCLKNDKQIDYDWLIFQINRLQKYFEKD